MKNIVMLSLIFSLSCFAGKKTETYVRSTQELVDGQTFTHQVTVVDGAISELWSIDGKEVSAQEYRDKNLLAYTAEHKAEMKAAEEQHQLRELEIAKQQTFARQSRVAIHKRLVAEQVAGIEQELARVKDARLEPYYVFDASAFETRDAFAQLSSDLLAQAKALLAKLDDEITEAELIALASQLEPQPARVRDFYRVSVKHAINTCDDTKLLKEFLELVA